jgi:hypothetical protein
MGEPNETDVEGPAAGQPSPLWRSVLVAGILAGLIDAGQYLVFPCTISGWFTLVVGFVFLFCGLLFFVLVSRKGSRLLSLIPLAISTLTAVPWLLSHLCG